MTVSTSKLAIDVSFPDIVLYDKDQVTQLGRPIAVFMVALPSSRIIRFSMSLNKNGGDAVTKALLNWVPLSAARNKTTVVEVDEGGEFTSKKFIEAALEAGYTIQRKRSHQSGGAAERALGRINRELQLLMTKEPGSPSTTLAELKQGLSKCVNKHNQARSSQKDRVMRLDS